MALIALLSLALAPGVSSVAVAADLGPDVPAGTAGDVVLGDFEDDGEGWAAWPQGGATGSFERISGDAISGAASGHVTLDLSAGGYVEVARDVPDVDLETLTFSVNSTTVTGIAVRFRDSTGQFFQHGLNLDPASAGWQTFTISDLANANYGHWGGSGDGVWRGPATQLAFNVDAGQVVDPTQTATYLIDAVQATLKDTLPPAPPVVPGAVLIGGFESDADEWGVFPQAGAVSGTYQRVASGDTSGGMSGEVVVDLSAGGYVELARDLNDLNLRGLAFSIRSTELTSVAVRFTDSTGQAFQHYRDTDPSSTGWQTFTVNDPAVGAAFHFGGANDGVWHGPATKVAFLVDAGQLVDNAQPARYLIDAVQAIVEPAPPAPSTTIGDFEADSEGWTASPVAGAAAGSLQRVTADSVTGDQSGLVTLDVSTGGYVELTRPLPGIDIDDLTFSVKSSEINGLSVRLRDSTGQYFQHALTLDPTAADWQTLTITDLAASNQGHWEGANDGVWHGPATAIAFNVDGGTVLDPTQPAHYLLDAVTASLIPADLALVTTALGNVFTAGDPVTVGFQTKAENLSWSLTNATGTVVTEGSGAAAELDATIPLTVATPGWYQLDVTAAGPGGEVYSASTTLAVLEDFDRAALKDTRFGVATHFGQWWDPEIVPLIEQAGFGSARDEAYWDQQETVQGTIEVTPKVLAYESALNAADVNLLLVMSYGNPFYEGGVAPVTDEGIAAFANYADAMVNHFGTDDTNFEVWNEWNIFFGGGPAGSRPDTYFNLLKKTYDTIKASNPDAEVIGPVSAQVPMEWIREFFELGGLDYIDALSVHPYTYPAGPEQLEGTISDLNALMDEFGGRKPIVISEIGWPTGIAARSIDDMTQAQYLVQSQTIALTHGVQQYFIYNFMDKGTDPSDTENRFGLIHNPGDAQGPYTPKPSYVSIATSQRLLAGKAALGQQELTGGVKDYAFDSGAGQTTHVLWADDPQSVSFTTSGPVTVTDLFGAATTIQPDRNGQVTVTAGTSPIYLDGPISAVANGGTYAFTVDAGFVGSDVSGHWTIDNSAGTSTLDAELQVEGQTLTASVPAGESEVVDVVLPGLGQPGSRTYTGLVEEEGAVVARLSATASITEAITLSAYHAISGGEEVLRIAVANRSDVSHDIGTVTWELGGAPGSALAGTVVAGGGLVTHDVPLGTLTSPMTFSVRLEMSSGLVLDASGNLNPTGPITPAVGRSLVVDGALDRGLEPTSRIDLAAAGAPDLPGWGGPSDLSGDLWFTWDKDFLYVSADVVDNVHVQTATGGNIWQGDSLQLGVASGAPGDATVWNELGFALTPEGPQSHQWFQSFASTADPIDVDVVRYEDTKHTVYEAAIPWTRLAPATPDGRLVSISAVLNDNDAASRRGWLAWGGGIAGEKTSTEFNSVQLIDPVPAATMTTLTVEGESVEGSELSLTAHVDPAGATGTVRFTDSGTELGTAPVSAGVATLTVNLSAGPHSIVAEYVPDVDAFAGSTSEPVTVSVRVPSTLWVLMPGVVTDKDRTAVLATVRADLTPSGTIEVREGDRLLISTQVSTWRQTGIAAFRLPRLPAGNHHLTISYSGNDQVAGVTVERDLRVLATRR